jgi:flagellar biosynthetic protein FlhB
VSDGEDKDSKTEDPTEKKIRDAAEKGNVPFSREVPVFASALAFYCYLVFFVPDGVANLAVTLKDLFSQPEQWSLSTRPDAVSILSHMIMAIAYLVMPAMLMFIAFGLASSILQNLPSPVLERVRPQMSRLSPVKGFNRIYSKQGLVEFAKSMFKIIVVSIIMAIALRNDFYTVIDMMFSDPQVIFTRLLDIMKKMMIVILFCTALLAVVDIFWTRHHWFTQLKMSKQEIKDEFKQAQGDPVMKARLRSLARDRIRRNMMSNVPRATLVIANPTHYAIALRYDREETDAPVVIALGKDLIALRIREIAEENGIPVFVDPPLARSMFAQVSVDSVIPPAFYRAVAELVHRVYSTKSPR